MEKYNEVQLIGIIAEFFDISVDDVFPKTELRKDLHAGSGEIYQLISESISDALDISIIYEVTDIFIVQDIFDVVKNAFYNQTNFQQTDFEDSWLVTVH